MAIWLVRAGSHGEYEQKFIQEKRVQEAKKQVLRFTYPALPHSFSIRLTLE